MGNADLRELAVIEEIAYDDLSGAVIAVDAHNWIYKYLTIAVRYTDESVYTTESADEVANLIGTLQGLPKFLEHDLVPVFVFDGTPTDLKADEIESRREQREAAQEQLETAREEGDRIEIARLESQTQELTPIIQETTRGLLDRLDIPYIEAPREGEAQAAHMARHDSTISHVGSDDYDTLLFGAPHTLRQLTSSGDPELMDLEATLDSLTISWEQLVDIGILAGTDFNDGLAGVGPKTALSEIREHETLWNVLDNRDATIPHAETVRELFLNPTVTEDYTIDRTISPDLSAARRYVTDEWEIPESEISRSFERIEDALSQTGLDRFT